MDEGVAAIGAAGKSDWWGELCVYYADIHPPRTTPTAATLGKAPFYPGRVPGHTRRSLFRGRPAFVDEPHEAASAHAPA